VQRAACIGKVPAVIVVIMMLCHFAMFVCVLMMVVRYAGGRKLQSTRAGRRHDARKLGDQEQTDQQAHEPGYRPQ